MTGTFGAGVSSYHVEKWIVELADKWFLEHLAESERIHGKAPRYWPDLKDLITANENEGAWPEELLPALLVMDTGLGSQPRRDGEGKWSATWLFGAAIIVSTTSRKDSREATQGYGWAFMQMLLQHKSLEHPENIEGLTWGDQRPMNLRTDDGRNLAAQQMFFYVDVKNIVDDRGAPPLKDPRPDPYVDSQPGPVIVDHGITINLTKEIAGP